MQKNIAMAGYASGMARWVFLLVLMGIMAVSSADAGEQIVIPSETSFQASPGDIITFTVRYSAASPSATTGLGVRLYYDSSKLALSALSDVFPQSKITQSIDSDSADEDGNAATDSRINVAWTSLGGGWPGNAGNDTDLFTVTFNVTQDFTADTTLNILGDASAGNTFSATPVFVTYTDTIAPEISAPKDLTIEASGALTAVSRAELGDPVVSDNQDEAPTVSYAPRGPFAVGIHTITWTATDSAGNTATAKQQLTVKDTVAPHITAPRDISTPATARLTPVKLGTPTVTDKVDPNPTVTANPEGPFGLGVHTVTWTATDASGNSATDTQTITITSTGAPKLVAPDNITREATARLTPVTFPVVTGTDIIDGQLTAIPDKTGPFGVGTHTIIWTVTNSQGLSATAVQTVTITDTTGPKIIPPEDKIVTATGENTPVDVGTATATDLVDGDVTVTSDAAATYPVGTHTVTWTATDSSNNTSTATQTITVTDGRGPSITPPADVTVEATGPTTEVALGEAVAHDHIDGDLLAKADNSGPFSVGVHTINWSVTNSRGQTATATQTVTVRDTTAPQITIDSDPLKVNATGARTPITTTGVTASDLVDGNVTPVVSEWVNNSKHPIPGVGLESGIHQLIWTATDKAGNSATKQQTIEITPLVNFSAAQSAGPGDKVTVSAILSGPPVRYPVKIPYSIDEQASTVANDGSDHDAVNGEIEITSGTEGSFSFNVAANPQLNGAGVGYLVFTMGTPVNALIGTANTHRVNISANNIAPVVELNIIQGSSRVTRVAKGAGPVTINAVATDSPAQTLSYDWGASDTTLIDLSRDGKENTFELNPETLAEGSYKISVTVSDNGSPMEQTTMDLYFNVVAGASPVVDSDGDGIEDGKDKIAESNRLPATENAGLVMESEAGTTLKLGKFARNQGVASASIGLADLPAIPTQYDNANLNVYDFEVAGVARGESVSIVLPQEKEIPLNAVYLKYDGQSWIEFVRDPDNEIYSAKGSASGNCPAVGSATYIPGLTKGDYCVQLKIKDGGRNDADGLVNGHISDPGVVVGPRTEVKPTSGDKTGDKSSSSGGSGSVSWIAIIILLMLQTLKTRVQIFYV